MTKTTQTSTTDHSALGHRPAAVLLESHMHTPLCRHATGEITDYAQAARDHNLAGVIVTCHNPMPDGYGSHMRMKPTEFARYIKAVQATQKILDGRADVRLGLEADFAPGYETFLHHQLSQAPFDFVLGSIHPQIQQYQDRYFHGDAWDLVATYFDHLAQAAETGLFDSLAHPDMVKYLLGPRWDEKRAMDDIVSALDRIANTGVALEFNTSGWLRTMQEPSPGPTMLREIARRQIPVTLGGDAHHPTRVGYRYRLALKHLHDAGHTHVSLYQNRQRQDIPIPQAHQSLTPPKTSVAAA